ncbi:hypothetical protein PHMEG_00026996 [Phytophthora megakarya]|uniref:Uncharacterized protein n=1 Tax=Phytophthora megakarya TaxID=4795 RepID=A0A225V881_9STRA|nr:hypothetical protein PHMEG_00026996 [Phytophthora megakarya]
MMSSSSGSPHAIDPTESPRRSPNGSGDSLHDPSSDGSVHELGPDDFLPNGCAIGATGFESPFIPPSSAVSIPAVGDPVPSVDALVADASALEHEAQVLRSRLELSNALNAGLATHAIVLHDQLIALRERAREGYNLGLQAGDCLSSEVETRDRIIRELRDDTQGIRDQAFQANTWRTQYNNLCKTTADEATSYQNALARANARISSLNSQLAAASVPALPLASTPVSTAASQTSVFGDELSRFRADLSSAQASVQSERSRVCSVTSERDSVRADSERRRVLCDTTAAVLDDARDSLDRSRRELNVARAANQPLQDDLRRVIALLMAHAEEHQRDVARIRDLETSSSTAEAARVSAQADRDSAQAGVLPLAGYISVRVGRCASFRHSAAPADTGAQQASLAEIARLEGLIDQSDLAYTEHTMTWRRLLREARAGRESARLVGDALMTRLSDMVTAVGGFLDVTQLVRSLESRVEASTYAATPLPPDLDPEIGRAAATLSGLPASTTPRSATASTAIPSSSAASTVDASTSTAVPTSSSAQGDPVASTAGASASTTPASPAVPASTSAQGDPAASTTGADLTLSSLTARALRVDHLPPRDWIFPVTSSPVPAFSDPTLLTERMPFVARYEVHLDHWAQAYWESTHEFPVPNTPAWTRWPRRRNSRRSHAGDHLVGTFQLLLILFQAGRVDMDVLLDVMVLLFPPGRSSVGRWYPDLRNSTLETALADIDAREPWRRFFRTQPDAAGNTTVEREHPAYAVRRLASKFVERGQSQP